MFSSRSFILSNLRSLILSVFGIRECSNLILLCPCPIFTVPLIEETLFSIFCSSLTCHRLIGHKCFGLLLGSLCCSLDSCVCLPVPCCLDYSSFGVQCEVRGMMLPALFLLFKIVLSIWFLLCLHTNFKISFSRFLKNSIDILIGIASNLCISLCSMVIYGEKK